MIGAAPGVVGQPWHHWAGGVPSLQSVVSLGFGLVVLWLALSAAAWWHEHGPSVRPRGAKPKPGAAPAHSPNVVASARAILASDAERDETSRVIGHAIGEGRLSIDDGRQRIDAACRASHRHELAELVADLPSGPHKGTGRSSPSSVGRLVLPVAVMVAVGAGLLQAFAGLWELWPVAVLTLGALAVRPRS